MKLHYLLFTALMLITSTIFAQDPQLANSSFESWEDKHTPNNWSTNSTGVIWVNYGAEKTEEATDGNYAVKLETFGSLTATNPGLLTTGKINIFTGKPYHGTPFVGRPTGIGFDYKYLPKDDDNGCVIIVLTKWNTETLKTDTVGGTLYFIKGEQGDYATKQIPIFYLSDETPDSINVTFGSSFFIKPKLHSTLYVDNVKMLYDQIKFPTMCLPAMNIQPKSFLANYMRIPYADGYTLEVAKDKNFETIIEGYPVNYGSEILPLPKPITTNEIANFFYRVKVNYADKESSEWSNVISVPMPTEMLDF